MTGIVREFVGLPSPVVGRAGAGGHPCQGIYHRPASGLARVAFIATHYNVDFSEHYLASFMAEAGLRVPRLEHQVPRQRGALSLDHALAEIGVGVRWLREQAGAEQVVLLGNSGGGSLMAAYQSQATEPTVRPVAGMRPLPAVEDLPPGDLYVALAAHSGRPEVLTAWLDASVTDEGDPLSADPSLDPLRSGQRAAVRRGLPAPLPGRAARPQRAHHRLGAGGARPAGWDAGQGPAVHGPAQLG